MISIDKKDFMMFDRAANHISKAIIEELGPRITKILVEELQENLRILEIENELA